MSARDVIFPRADDGIAATGATEMRSVFHRPARGQPSLPVATTRAHQTDCDWMTTEKGSAFLQRPCENRKYVIAPELQTEYNKTRVEALCQRSAQKEQRAAESRTSNIGSASTFQAGTLMSEQQRQYSQVRQEIRGQRPATLTVSDRESKLFSDISVKRAVDGSCEIIGFQPLPKARFETSAHNPITHLPRAVATVPLFENPRAAGALRLEHRDACASSSSAIQRRQLDARGGIGMLARFAEGCSEASDAFKGLITKSADGHFERARVLSVSTSGDVVLSATSPSATVNAKRVTLNSVTRTAQRQQYAK